MEINRDLICGSIGYLYIYIYIYIYYHKHMSQTYGFLWKICGYYSIILW
jgi:hypothetical protein